MRQNARSWSLPPDQHPRPATIPAWPNRATWLRLVDAWAASDDAGDDVRAAHTSIASVLAVARYDAACADSATGRNVTTSRATAARALGLSTKVIQRARAVLERIGLSVKVAAGRYLTHAERAEAGQAHGGYQSRAANTWWLTVPKTLPQWAARVHLPRRGSVTPKSPSRGVPNATRKRARRYAHPSRTSTPAPIAAQRLAARLVQRVPLLREGQHIGALVRGLDAAGLTQWRCNELIDVVDARNRDLGLFSLPLTSQRNPIALFLHQATLATAGKQPPHVDAAREAQRRDAQRAQERAAALRARERAADPAHNETYQRLRAELRARGKSWRRRTA